MTGCFHRGKAVFMKWAVRNYSILQLSVETTAPPLGKDRRLWQHFLVLHSKRRKSQTASLHRGQLLKCSGASEKQARNGRALYRWTFLAIYCNMSNDEEGVLFRHRVWNRAALKKLRENMRRPERAATKIGDNFLSIIWYDDSKTLEETQPGKE